eukprot:jgi/Ulvmu1/2811/UM142_0009.1
MHDSACLHGEIMAQALVVRCELTNSGEIVTRVFEHQPISATSIELHVGDHLVNRCSVLRDLKHVLGEAPLPHADPRSFRLWLHGEYDGQSDFRAALGALQIAIFLGDDGQDEWARIAGVLLCGSLADGLRATGTLPHAVRLVESLGDDALDKVISATPLDYVLAEFSEASHIRAVQLRTHYDDSGPHLTIELSERFSDSHAAALIAAVTSRCNSVQHTSVTLRPSWLAFPPGTPRPHPALSGKASTAWGTPFVNAERWNGAVTAVAQALAAMPQLSHLYCPTCSLGAAAAACLPLDSVATLHLQENELGQSMGFLGADHRKPVFDRFIRRLVSHDVSQVAVNTVIQELNLSSNNLGAAMVPATTTPYRVWNRDIWLALHCMPNLTRLDLSNNQLSVEDLGYIFEPPYTHPYLPISPGPPWGAFPTDTPGPRSLSQLQDLNVSKNELCGCLRDILKHMTRLTRLDLSDTSLRAANAADLAPLLLRMTAMQWLNLGGNRITRRAAPSLGAAFARMRSLRHLNASGHVLFNFSAEGVQSLVLHLGGLTALEHLDLSKQGMGERGAEALAQVVKQLPRLTCLEVSGNGLCEAGTTALAPALPALPELVALGLADNGLTDAAVATVAHAVIRLPELRRVKLDGNVMAKWSCDWGKGFVGKDVLHRWLEES